MAKLLLYLRKSREHTQTKRKWGDACIIYLVLEKIDSPCISIVFDTRYMVFHKNSRVCVSFLPSLNIYNKNYEQVWMSYCQFIFYLFLLYLLYFTPLGYWCIFLPNFMCVYIFICIKVPNLLLLDVWVPKFQLNL